MATGTCPVLGNYVNENKCLENIAGTSAVLITS